MLKEDAEDVVELMVESTRQVLMDGAGQIDKARGGVRGKSKNRRLFLEAVRKSGRNDHDISSFHNIADKIGLPLEGFKDFVESLKEDGELLKKHDGVSKYYYRLP